MAQSRGNYVIVLVMMVGQELLSIGDVIINVQLSPSSVLEQNPTSLAHIAMWLLEVSLRAVGINDRIKP